MSNRSCRRPPPRHIVAHQLLALCLQEHQVGERTWREWWGDLPLFDESTSRFVQHLLDEGFLEWDSEMLFIGPEAEKQFGRHHFMGITAVFCAPPQFRVISGRADIGLVEVGMLVEEVPGPRLILLTGRTCRVTHIDWRRQRCFAEAYDGSGGRARWTGRGAVPSVAMCRARRDVILGADPPVRLTARGGPGPAAGLTSSSQPRCPSTQIRSSRSATTDSGCAKTFLPPPAIDSSANRWTLTGRASSYGRP
ncbi:hypothetical protein ACFZAM_01750 [Streptomyces sp. NPDC008079]|uniref:hypothetical protein n=1 Tax=Streptomyces sp. NPDC008079 TaxID=3364806 RepID=UPI0036E43F61